MIGVVCSGEIKDRAIKLKFIISFLVRAHPPADSQALTGSNLALGCNLALTAHMAF